MVSIEMGYVDNSMFSEYPQRKGWKNPTSRLPLFNKFADSVEPIPLEINNENNNENKFIVKIDVQGHDETIFQEIPENILKNTEILIIEITPLETKKFDLDKFNSKLKIFSKYTNFENDSITLDQINKFVNMSSGESIDLILIK